MTIKGFCNEKKKKNNNNHQKNHFYWLGFLEQMKQRQGAGFLGYLSPAPWTAVPAECRHRQQLETGCEGGRRSHTPQQHLEVGQPWGTELRVLRCPHPGVVVGWSSDLSIWRGCRCLPPAVVLGPLVGLEEVRSGLDPGPGKGQLQGKGCLTWFSGMTPGDPREPGLMGGRPRDLP